MTKKEKQQQAHDELNRALGSIIKCLTVLQSELSAHQKAMNKLFSIDAEDDAVSEIPKIKDTEPPPIPESMAKPQYRILGTEEKITFAQIVTNSICSEWNARGVDYMTHENGARVDDKEFSVMVFKRMGEIADDDRVAALADEVGSDSAENPLVAKISVENFVKMFEYFKLDTSALMEE